MFNPCKVLFVYHDILGNSSCPKAKHSDLLWGGKSWQPCVPPFSEGHCITWQPCWDRSPLQKERLGQHPLRKKNMYPMSWFPKFYPQINLTLELCQSWQVVLLLWIINFDQYVTNDHLTESFLFSFSFLLVKDKTVVQKFAFFFPFPTLAAVVGHCEPVHVCRHFQAIFHMISHSVSVNV